MSEPTLRVEEWPIKRLTPYDKNPRRHSERGVTKLRASIERFGFVNPVLVLEDGTVLAGHGRLMAAEELGLKKVPVVVLDIPADKARAYRIADNRLQEDASWNYRLLAAELDRLLDSGFELDYTFLDDPEIEVLIDQYSTEADEDFLKDMLDDISEPPEDEDSDSSTDLPPQNKEFVTLRLEMPFARKVKLLDIVDRFEKLRGERNVSDCVFGIVDEWLTKRS